MKEGEARGMSTLTLKPSCKRTAKNYHNLAATQEGVSLTSSTIAKTDRQYASDTALRPCASLGVAIAYNHLIEGDNEIHEKLGERVQQFLDLLKDVSDVPITPVKSHNMYSTDKTECIYEDAVESTYNYHVIHDT